MKKFVIAGFALIHAFMLTVVFVFAWQVGQYTLNFDYNGVGVQSGVILDVQSIDDEQYYQIEYLSGVIYTPINDIDIMFYANGEPVYYELTTGHTFEMYFSELPQASEFIVSLDETVVYYSDQADTGIYVKVEAPKTLYDVIYNFYMDTVFNSENLETPDNILQIMTVSTVFLIALIPVALVAGAVKKLWS